MAEYFAGGHLRFVDGEWRDDDGNMIEVSEVRHARWGVEVGMNFFKERNCPVCKKRIESNFWNFCPNCGCRMDLEG